MQKRKFPLLPVVAVLMQIVAVLLLILIVFKSWQDFQSTFKSWAGGMSPYGQSMPAITKFGDRMNSLMQPISGLLSGLFLPFFAWLFADLLFAAREIEFNTRRALGLAGEPVPAEAPAKE